MTPERTLTAGGRPRGNAEPLFTLERANRALVLVRKIVADIVTRHGELVTFQRQRQGLNDSPGCAEQAETLERRMHACAHELNALHDELSAVGCALKDWNMGLVDFPAQYHGRRVWLCWHLGEPVVTHWHECHDGFAGRRPIDRSFAP